MKSLKFYCLVLITNYIFKTIDMMDSSWISELIRKYSDFNNYLEKLFRKAFFL